MIITIDGPAGTGKSTVAKAVAHRLGLAYFDTGALYRALTWKILQEKILLEEESRIADLLTHFAFSITEKGGALCYLVDGVDVTTQIRSQKVNQYVSQVSALPIVRENLWKIQREFGSNGGTVFEGRDMGSVVFPEADLKIFLTATPAVRAKRRFAEIQAKFPERKEQSEEAIAKEIAMRDHIDQSREIAPLVRPEGSMLIDTSMLSIDEVVDKIVKAHVALLKKWSSPWRHLSTFKHPLYGLVLGLTWCAFRLLYRTKVYGLSHYVKGAGIIAANHISYLDPPLIAISVPEPIHFLARKSLFSGKWFGKLISALNAHPVSGSSEDLGVFKLIIRLIGQGSKVLIFPEGSRALNGEIQPLQRGIGLLMEKTKAPIVPTYLCGTYDAWKRGQSIPRLRGKTACIFGSPILWQEFMHIDRKEVHEAVAKRVFAAWEGLDRWYKDGAQGTPP